MICVRPVCLDEMRFANLSQLAERLVNGGKMRTKGE